jgi:hypothetical protein
MGIAEETVASRGNESTRDEDNDSDIVHPVPRVSDLDIVQTREFSTRRIREDSR